MGILDLVSKVLKVCQIIVSLSGLVSIFLKYYMMENATKYSDACCGYINNNGVECNYNQYETYGFSKDINNVCIVNGTTCTTFPKEEQGDYYMGYYYVSKGGDFSNCTVNKTSIYNSSNTEIDTFDVDETKLLNTTCTQDNINQSISWDNDQLINFLLWFIVSMPGFIFAFYLSISELLCQNVYLTQKVYVSMLCCPCIYCCCPCEGKKCSKLKLNLGYYFAKFIFYCFSSMGNDQFNSGINNSSYFSISDWSGESNDIFFNCHSGFNPLVYDNSKLYNFFNIVDTVVRISIYTGYVLTVAQFLLSQYKDKETENERNVELIIN
eukprot:88885_1